MLIKPSAGTRTATRARALAGLTLVLLAPGALAGCAAQAPDGLYEDSEPRSNRVGVTDSGMAWMLCAQNTVCQKTTEPEYEPEPCIDYDTSDTIECRDVALDEPDPWADPSYDGGDGYGYDEGYDQWAPVPLADLETEPTAVCRDGWLSYSQTRQGTCSHHGGVREWLR